MLKNDTMMNDTALYLRNHKQLAAEDLELLAHTRRIITEELALALAVPFAAAEERITELEQLWTQACSNSDQ